MKYKEIVIPSRARDATLRIRACFAGELLRAQATQSAVFKLMAGVAA